MKQQSFFDSRTQSQPLAARLRPETLEEFAGQRHLLGEGKILRQLIDQDLISSMIFWGPPGVGKTCLLYTSSVRSISVCRTSLSRSWALLRSCNSSSPCCRIN